MKRLATPLARVRGLGSAKDGVGHWWAQRLTAVALVPLLVWFVASVVAHAGASYEAFQAWVANPFVAIFLVLTIAMTFHHGQLGMQVVIEDYVHEEGPKLALLLLVKAAALVLGLIGIFAVLRIAFAG